MSTTSLDTLGGNNNNLPRLHLLNLPVELMDKIIALVVVDPSRAIHTNIKPHRALAINAAELGVKLAPLIQPALSRTCVVLDKLTSPIYYGHNIFGFISAHEAVDWLDSGHRSRSGATLRKALISPATNGNHEIRRHHYWFWVNFAITLWPESEAAMDRIFEEFDDDLCETCRDLIKGKMKEIMDKARKESAATGRTGTNEFIRWLGSIDKLAEQSETRFNDRVFRLACWLSELCLDDDNDLFPWQFKSLDFEEEYSACAYSCNCVACNWVEFDEGESPGEASLLESYRAMGGA